MNYFKEAGLEYLLPAPPPDGIPVYAAPAVRWLRLTLPLALDHINVWLLDDGDGWTLVDTGIALPVTRAQWDGLLCESFDGKRIHRIVVTHFHPDHLGLAGHLGRELGCDVWMTAESAEIAHGLLGGGAVDLAEVDRFCATHGFPDLAEYRRIASGTAYRDVVSEYPANVRELKDGQILESGGRNWRVRVVGGHARGHAILYCAADKLLISGDQILPAITTNVSLSPGVLFEPDPLGAFLDSFEHLATLPEDTLVLPSHGGVFRGLHTRIEQLRRHHHGTLERLVDWCGQPVDAWTLTLKLFGRREPGLHSVLAFGETLAHLEYLCRRGRLLRTESGDRTFYRGA